MTIFHQKFNVGSGIA